MPVLKHLRMSPDGADALRNVTQELKSHEAELGSKQLPADWIEQNKKTAQKNWQKERTADLASTVSV
jgi:hypothetical protein